MPYPTQYNADSGAAPAKPIKFMNWGGFSYPLHGWVCVPITVIAHRMEVFHILCLGNPRLQTSIYYRSNLLHIFSALGLFFGFLFLTGGPPGPNLFHPPPISGSIYFFRGGLTNNSTVQHVVPYCAPWAWGSGPAPAPGMGPGMGPGPGCTSIEGALLMTHAAYSWFAC